MTVLKIKKALECCYAYDLKDRDMENCHECPYLTYVEEPCFNKLAKDALKTIDELEKRNEPIEQEPKLLTLMDKRQVMYDIERCISHVPDACRDCSHYTGTVGFGCMEDLLADALTLLKEQEPKILTLEEVKAFDWEYCYLEEERLPGKEYRTVCGDYALTCITWPCVASLRIQYGDNSYGKKWRCWSAKPTDEQRQAVKWEWDC